MEQGKNIAEKNMMKFLNRVNFSGNYYDEVSKTFANYSNVKLIKGMIPESLNSVPIKKISYLSMDMNNAYGEMEAIKFFWDKIVKSGIVLLDDYATHDGFKEQKISWNNFAKNKNFEILTLPTGQGLIIKN